MKKSSKFEFTEANKYLTNSEVNQTESMKNALATESSVQQRNKTFSNTRLRMTSIIKHKL